jgi:hypothetical protein
MFCTCTGPAVQVLGNCCAGFLTLPLRCPDTTVLVSERCCPSCIDDPAQLSRLLSMFPDAAEKLTGIWRIVDVTQLFRCPNAAAQVPKTCWESLPPLFRRCPSLPCSFHVAAAQITWRCWAGDLTLLRRWSDNSPLLTWHSWACAVTLLGMSPLTASEVLKGRYTFALTMMCWCSYIAA